jgi:prepilin-type N-terminal cleavage/methylation domain-containing protein
MIVRTDHSRPPLQTARVPVSDQWPVISDQWSVVSGRVSGSRPRPRISDFGFPASKGYTLLELLTVITIMGLMAALVAPTLRALRPNAKVAATRELLDAVGRARQLAISQRTTVYMVFLSTNFWSDIATNSWTPNDNNWKAVMNLCDKQLTGYAYVTLRSVGDQPGAYHPSYLSAWRTLPPGAYIPREKFDAGLTFTNTELAPGIGWFPGKLPVPPFTRTSNIPFPLETTPPLYPPPATPQYVSLPYIAFDGMGQLVSGGATNKNRELIPVSEGTVSVARDPNTKAPLMGQSPTIRELPVGNTTNNYSLVYIDRLTGRAHVERRKVQ